MELLFGINRRHNDKKMARTFAYKRDNIRGNPTITGSNLPGLFTVAENETVEDLNVLFKEHLMIQMLRLFRGTFNKLSLVPTASYGGGDAATPSANVGIVIEGVEILRDFGDVTSA